MSATTFEWTSAKPDVWIAGTLTPAETYFPRMAQRQLVLAAGIRNFDRTRRREIAGGCIHYISGEGR